MPRRKYGHLIGACPPTPKEKCRYCKLGRPCPVHKAELQKPSLLGKKRSKLKHLARR